MNVSLYHRSILGLLSFWGLLLSVESKGQGHGLDDYLRVALARSPLLNDYRNQSLSTRIDSQVITAMYGPQLFFAAQAMVAPAFTDIGYDDAITNGGSYNGQFVVAQPLFTKRFKQPQLQGLSLTRQTLGLSEKSTTIDIQKAITTQYIQVYADYRQIGFSKSILELIQHEQEVMKVLVERGVYQVIDYMNLSVAIRSQQLLVRQAWNQYRTDLSALNYTAGIVDTAMVVVTAPDIQLKGSTDIQNSPLMQQFRVDSLKNSNSKTLVKMNYLPKVNAFADAGFYTSNPLHIPSNFGSSIGISFTAPIYDGGQQQMQIDKIDITEKTRQGYQSFYTDQYEQQRLQLQQSLQLNEQVIAETREQLKELEKLIALYQTEIEKGLVRFSDFLTVVNNYAVTQNNLTTAEINRLQLINQLNHLK